MASGDDPRLIRVQVERLVVAATRQRAALAARLDLIPSDLLALTSIARAGELSPGALARALTLSSSGTTAVTRRLERAELVTRTAGPANHRNVALHATAKGVAVRDQALAPLAGGDLDDLTSALTVAERAKLERLLGSLADRFERDADRLLRETAVVDAAASGIPSPVRWG